MKKFILSTAFMAVTFFTATWLVSCSDDDDNPQPPGNAVISFENVTPKKLFVQSGTFGEESLIMPDDQVSFTFNAGKGQRLMFATMYAYSDDMFFAPENPGIQLFDDNGRAITGDVSDQIKMWDNGTRTNQVPGPNLSPGQAEAANVTQVQGMDAQQNTYPAASELMRLELTYNSVNSQFTATITNISRGNTRETPFSPGVWAISNIVDGDDLASEFPLYHAGEKTTAALTALAENGNNGPLAEYLEQNTGIITSLSKAIVVVYTGETNPLYTLNQRDPGVGMKQLAEKGDPEPLKDYLERMRLVRRVYIVGDDPIESGERMESQFEAYEGENIAFATMFGYSNDWFFTNGTTISAVQKGDVSSRVVLLDNGTAVSQYPGAGNSQALFDGTNQLEQNNVTPVDNTYPLPAITNMIKVTLR